MNHDYEDIRLRIQQPPLWFDENAVPRYCDFGPSECANIYAEEAALVLITCQGCDMEFKVAFSQDAMTRHTGANGKTLADQIRAQALHYGDPPNIGCCADGPTMNSAPRRVLEYWHWRQPKLPFEWLRDQSLEVPIEPDWVKEAP